MSQASATFQNADRARRLKDSFWLFERGAGIKHVLERLGPPIESWWRDLAVTSITPKVIEKLREGERRT